jgi:hypothetical protein
MAEFGGNQASSLGFCCASVVEGNPDRGAPHVSVCSHAAVPQTHTSDRLPGPTNQRGHQDTRAGKEEAMGRAIVYARWAEMWGFQPMHRRFPFSFIFLLHFLLSF